MSTSQKELLHLINRRAFLNRSVHSLGAMALGSLIHPAKAAKTKSGSIIIASPSISKDSMSD